MATANIKITALSDITSANMTFNDLVAVVDMNGTPETKKATIQLVGNLILNGAGGSYFPAAAQAVLAQSVTNAAQPNITSVGTLSSLAVTANVSAGNLSASGTINGVLVGEGGNISNVQVGNVAGLGNIATINLDGNVSNVFRGDGTFGPEGAGGNANYANFAGTAFAVAGANVSGEVGFAAVANSVALANVSSAGNIASINLDGNVSNVLRGDGTFAADSEGTYGDSNVVSLLGAFGSNTISTTGNVSVGTLSGSNGAAFISTADNQFVVERDNGTSFRFKGNNIDGNTVQTYAGIFYNPVYGNTPETQTRLLIGSNEDVSIELQTSNEMRISAVDDNTGGGKVRIASGDGNGSPYAIEFHPGTLAEVDNLVVEINTGGLEVTGNLSATGNISAVNLGNVSAVNLDGNVANVLAGDGTFTALPVINANTVIWTTAPTANNDPGTAGEIAYDAGGNLYVCVSTNTWSKFSGTTSW